MKCIPSNNNNISFNTRKIFPMTNIVRIATCKCEILNLNSKSYASEINSLEMWWLIRIYRISLTRNSNSDVLSFSKMQNFLRKSIRTRQLIFFRHSLRKQHLDNLNLTGKIMRQRARGRQREAYLSYFLDPSNKLLRMTKDRPIINGVYAAVNVNVRNKLGS